MRRFLIFVLTLLIGGAVVLAQNDSPPQPGDPPVAALITVGPPDAVGTVTITGATGAVFPSAQVAVRNLYTGDVAYAQAGVTGTFEARLFGPGNTPFWISPADNIPNNVRNQPGSLPGGPGTIIYGDFPAEAAATTASTQILIDGSLDDWTAYPAGLVLRAGGRTAYAIHNQESVYMALALDDVPEDYSEMTVFFQLEGAVYRAAFDPRLPEEAATWSRLSPLEADLGTLAVSKTAADAVEFRLPLQPLRSVLGAQLDEAFLERFEFLDADGSALTTIAIMQSIQAVEEADGIVYPPDSRIANPIRFTASGPVAQGASNWTADGRINTLDFAAGDNLRMQLDVNLNVPDLPETLVGVSMVGQLALQPIIGADGQQATGGINSNNGWSAVLTPSGLAVDNLRSNFALGETIVPAPQVLRLDDALAFGLDFDLTLPENLPPGVYGLLFAGYGQIADGERFRWRDNGLFGTGDDDLSTTATRLPVILTVNESDLPAKQLVWSLFYDHPSEGSRGVLAQEDQAQAALSNRVHFNNPTYILPPYADPASEQALRYPLEPYIVSQLPNSYDRSGAPLIPFDFPGGQLAVKVTRPDGTLDDLGRSTLFQSRLSTDTEDERARFGTQSPVDVYRLTTLNPIFTRFQFTQYGLYTIDMQGEIADVWGNRYEGGGTYEVLIAELFDLMPGVMSGTPFEVGDTFYAGLQVTPGAAADVTITARIYPLDGSPMIEHVINGQANRNGYFSGEGFDFTTPGEYVVDYEARYTDDSGRLWAGSHRSAGVIASPEADLIAHGRRGLRGYYPGIRPAWFTTRLYGPDDDSLRLSYPYHSGDVLWYAADSDNTVQPGLTAQDTTGAYAQWLKSALPDYVAPDGQTIDRRIARDELPVFMVSENQPGYNPVLQTPSSEAYLYFSAVRPGLTVRQYVLGGDDPGLPLYWDTNDPYNEQIGSGLMGDMPGDFVFLFGGMVVRNAEAEITETAIYGASAFAISDRGDELGPRVYPPYRGAAGGPDGGPLLTIRDEPITMFFHPTGVRPGQVLTIGDTLAIAGQIAPTLASDVSVEITSPSGETRRFNGTANAIGYYYDAANDFAVDEPGIWTIDIDVQHTGLSSAGPVQPPYPQGDVLGTEDGRFNVYVVPPDASRIDWNDTRQDFEIPGALAFNFNFRIPEDWTNTAVDHTVTIPGYVLRSGPLPVSGASFSFQHNPTNLNMAFPNVEVDARLNGPAAADPVTITFAVTGIDAGGERQIQTRTFTILYDRLLTLN
ncbi:MAG: hypothetical protein CL610_23365 [Anaerolineaceae bacterium]|nr:hypothetical protein [Anaerolineaceae bacterium]